MSASWRSGLLLGFFLSACARPDLPVCGNSQVETGEVCDDGNAVTETCEHGQNKCTVCTSTCQQEEGLVIFCGDGRVNGDESCDDGNAFAERCAYGLTSCSVCGPLCTSVAGEAAFCGDGRQDSDDGEECDDGNAITDICPDDAPCTVCGANCTPVAGARPRCGDGTVHATHGETCDDGNLEVDTCAYGETSCMVCGPSCTAVAGNPTVCGDGLVDAAAGELCDDGNALTETCDYGTNCVVCDATCQRVAAQGPACGDGQLDTTDGEACDDGNAVTEVCAYGSGACQVCNAACQSVAGVTSGCGDARVDTANGEACDDGNTITDTCEYGAASCSVCSGTCQPTAGLISRCGDSQIFAAAGEDCDDGNAITESCTYGATSCTVCSSTCRLQDGVSSRCGDGRVDPSNAEQCDDGNMVDDDGCEASCRFACGGSVGQTRAYQRSTGCYLFFSESKSWYDAQTTCAAAGSNLATVRSSTENSFLVSIGGAQTVYIGFNDLASDGRYVWQSGQSIPYTNWDTGEPNGSTGENCAELYANGRWNDGNCTTTRPFICSQGTCGDGVLDSIEICDDGNNLDGDSCPANCSLCGNGVVTAGEQCDDGNSSNNDSCTNLCKTAFCGDGHAQTGETCDDGNTLDGDGCDACQRPCVVGPVSINAFTARKGSCYARPNFNASSDIGQARCVTMGGNLATLDDEEEDAYVRTLRGGAGTYQMGFNNKDGGVYGWRSGLDSSLDHRAWSSFTTGGGCFNGSTSSMKWSPALCTSASHPFVCELDLTTCGNGAVDSAYEQCDDNNRVTETCTYGQTSCAVCTRSCQLEQRARYCGDGKVTDTELCDDGNTATGDGCESCAVTSGFGCFGAPSLCLANSQVLQLGPGLDAGVPDDAYAVGEGEGTMKCLDLAVAANPDGGSNMVRGVFVTLGLQSSGLSDLIIKLKGPVGDVVTLMSLPGRFETLGDIEGTAGLSQGLLVTTHPITFADGAARNAELLSISNSPTQAVCRDDGFCAFDPNAGAHAAGKLSTFKGRSAVGTWQVCLGDMNASNATTVDQVRLGIAR